MKTTVTALALSGTVAVMALGGIGAAEAGGKKHFKFHHWNHHHHHHHHHRPHYFGHDHHGCGFYKVRWHQTGKFYWKKKYFICKGWW